MISKILSYFLPKGIDRNSPDIRSDRIFIGVLLISGLANFLNIPTAQFIHLNGVGTLLFTNAVLSFIILLLYKHGLSKKIAAHLHIAQHAVSFCFQAWFQGGLSSPALVSMFLLPGVIILVLGKKDAIFWFIVSLLIIAWFYFDDITNGTPIAQYDQDQRSYFYFSSVLGINVVIFFILLVYENGKNQAMEIIKQRHADLLSTQERLVQSEKLASLGELTAGIAHEIQNPLNFVNNFSELSMELASELKEEFGKLKLPEKEKDYLGQLLSDIVGNQEKINHHGNRADYIVKGMLRHSRSSSGEKEPTDINKLADEYLKLAYHGLRAKDKSFNATLVTDYDQNIKQINVVPQDIGRVILNLLTNAFYAVKEKAKQNSSDEYVPTVSLSTKLTGDKIRISVIDNGNGIPEQNIDKIFQPFFTTKATGKGTGLGLSMAYDIITKGHEGLIKVNSEDGKFTEFLIDLNI